MAFTCVYVHAFADEQMLCLCKDIWDKDFLICAV